MEKVKTTTIDIRAEFQKAVALYNQTDPNEKVMCNREPFLTLLEVTARYIAILNLMTNR